MKIINKLPFATLAALAATLLFQTSIARADDDHERRGRDRDDAKATFTKWIVDFPNQPGLIANMAGVVGGDVGRGTYAGEILLFNPGPVTTIVARYHFTGRRHSFTALVHIQQTGLKAVIIGVVTDGWLKGHAVKGKYTQITCEHDGLPPSDCFQGYLEIEGDSND